MASSGVGRISLNAGTIIRSTPIEAISWTAARGSSEKIPGWLAEKLIASGSRPAEAAVWRTMSKLSASCAGVPPPGKKPSPRRPARSAAARLQVPVRGRGESAPCGHESETEPGDDGDDRREGEHRKVQADLLGAGHGGRAERHESGHGPPGEEDTQNRADCGQKD